MTRKSPDQEPGPSWGETSLEVCMLQGELLRSREPRGSDLTSEQACIRVSSWAV